MSRRLLFIANHQSIFSVQLCDWLKRTSQCTIDIADFLRTEETSQSPFDRIYRLDQTQNPMVARSKTFNQVIKNSRHSPYDCAHLHFFGGSIFKLLSFMLCKTNLRKIVSVYGSDFYLRDSKTKLLQRLATPRVDRFSFANEMLRDSFLETYGGHLRPRCYICRFGMDSLEHIDQTIKDQSTARERFNLPKDRIVVVCGYSASDRHQHRELINTLGDTPPQIKNQCCFVFPMTYGDKAYGDEIDMLLSNRTDLQTVTLRNYMSNADIAQLRLASDVMINVPISDQLSCAMQEHLYARNIVINGGWLPYQIIEEKGAHFLKVDSVDHVAKKLIDVVENINSHQARTSENPAAIRKLSSWEDNIYDWLKLYE